MRIPPDWHAQPITIVAHLAPFMHGVLTWALGTFAQKSGYDLHWEWPDGPDPYWTCT